MFFESESQHVPGKPVGKNDCQIHLSPERWKTERYAKGPVSVNAAHRAYLVIAIFDRRRNALALFLVILREWRTLDGRVGVNRDFCACAVVFL